MSNYRGLAIKLTDNEKREILKLIEAVKTLPDKLKSSLPSIEEIEAELSGEAE